MAATSTVDDRLLSAPLWYVKLPGHGCCVAQIATGAFLVLFTSRALAEEFIRLKDLSSTEGACSSLYSRSRVEFVARARVAAARGICGTVVDLRSDGRVLDLIEFQELIDLPGAWRFLGSDGQTIH